MSEFFSSLRHLLTDSLLASVSIFDILDILIIWLLLYQLLKVFQHTKAMHVLKGLVALIIALAIAAWLGLPTLTWLLSSVFTSGIVILVVLFQPELRRVFESLGRGHMTEAGSSDADTDQVINEIVTVSDRLSRRRVGALMVFEQKSDLKDIISTGTTLSADISSELIENVFEPNTPLHDGAMILSGSKIVAAGCFLPLSENMHIEKTLGTRHRAALGMSERSDALVIVVSEETGVISAAHNGSFQRFLDLDSLRELLTEAYTSQEVTEEKSSSSLLKLISKVFGKGEKE